MSATLPCPVCGHRTRNCQGRVTSACGYLGLEAHDMTHDRYGLGMDWPEDPTDRSPDEKPRVSGNITVPMDAWNEQARIIQGWQGRWQRAQFAVSTLIEAADRLHSIERSESRAECLKWYTEAKEHAKMLMGGD